MRWAAVVLLLFLLFYVSALSQENISDLQAELKKIKEEISRLESQLQTVDNKLKSETNSLNNIDRQISLVSRKISLYRSEIELKNKDISKLQIKIDSLQKKISLIQEIYKDQALFAYKYQRGKHLDWLLGASTFHQALVRYQYFRKAASAERISYEKLKELQDKLKQATAQMNERVKSVQSLVELAVKEERNLKDKREIKARLISQILNNQRQLADILRVKKERYRKLSRLIASLEKKRSVRKLETKTQIQWEELSGSFARNKGKLNWPVRGSVLHKFGKFKNPKLKTVLNNTGIDIKAPRGSEIRCVFSGVVSLITYISGFGNTVIVDHNDGYYTVYAHMDQVLVQPDEFVKDGHVIGTVGETGSLEGPKLHFEIYGNNQPLNPLKWLSKK